MSFKTTWGLYKLFNDPPGTPKEIKCVGCKLAMAGSSLGLGTLLLIVGRRKGVKNVYIGSVFGITGILSISLSGFFFRNAHENKKYNEILMRDQKQKQIENFENLKKEKQQS